MPDEPTPRELLIHVNNLVVQLANITQRVDDISHTLNESYVPRGEYVEARKGDERRFSELENNLNTQAGFRRQVAAGFLIGALLVVLNLVIALSRTSGIG